MRVVGPTCTNPPSPEYECVACGASYYGRGAALACCCRRVVADGGHQDPHMKWRDETAGYFLPFVGDER